MHNRSAGSESERVVKRESQLMDTPRCRCAYLPIGGETPETGSLTATLWSSLCGNGGCHHGHSCCPFLAAGPTQRKQLANGSTFSNRQLQHAQHLVLPLLSVANLRRKLCWTTQEHRTLVRGLRLDLEKARTRPCWMIGPGYFAECRFELKDLGVRNQKDPERNTQKHTLWSDFFCLITSWRWDNFLQCSVPKSQKPPR